MLHVYNFSHHELGGPLDVHYFLHGHGTFSIIVAGMKVELIKFTNFTGARLSLTNIFSYLYEEEKMKKSTCIQNAK